PASASDALVEARAAMASRDFQRVVNITTEILTNDLMNDEARILGDEAREKLEAGPFVEQFAKKCEQHIAAGNIAAARQDLEKARQLDAGHPAIRKIEQMVTAVPAPAPAPAPGGFSFDSPAPASGGFSFDTPAPSSGSFSFDQPAAAKPPASGDFDFSTAGETSADDQKKIGQYLADGDRAFDGGEYQS